MRSLKGLGVGMSVADFVIQFADLFPSVRRFHFIIYKPWISNVQNRVTEVIEKKQVNESSDFGEPKWNFEKSLISRVSKEVQVIEIAKRLLLHDKAGEEKKIVSVSCDHLKEWYSMASKALFGNEEAIGLTSICETIDGELVHIPMMDFSCSISNKNLNFIKTSIVEMGFESGVMVNSGRSYHFYGERLLTFDQWIDFMGKSLLLSPFTDSRYIAHRLIAGRCILRINATATKTELPRIVEII